MIMKLPPEFKAKWLEALRSGTYKQTKKALHSKDGFCCLGVACDLADPKTWSPRGFDSYLHETKLGTLYMPAYEDFPEDVAQSLWSTITSEDRVMHRLADMNDAGKSFTEIASWIEENL